MRENRARTAPPATAGARSTGGPWRDRGFDPVAWRPPRPRLTADALHLDHGVFLRLVVGSVLAMVAAAAVVLGLLRAGW